VDAQALKLGANELGLELSPAQLAAFEGFEEALYRANESINLTRVPREECWRRHFLDSLLLSPLIPNGDQVLDIGTGPGFPAWPLACARPDLQVTALDSSGKMLGFLRSQPLENLAVIEGRAEDWGIREAFDFVTGRALAPLAIQLELSAPPCRLGGLVVPMRTPAEEEQFASKAFAELGLDLERVAMRQLSGSDVVRAFPMFRKSARTPKTFPRKWAEIRKKPLA
jgi:16S rRNA (guanine527-N7)-methyltransferase